MNAAGRVECGVSAIQRTVEGGNTIKDDEMLKKQLTEISEPLVLPESIAIQKTSAPNPEAENMPVENFISDDAAITAPDASQNLPLLVDAADTLVRAAVGEDPSGEITPKSDSELSDLDEKAPPPPPALSGEFRPAPQKNSPVVTGRVTKRRKRKATQRQCSCPRGIMTRDLRLHLPRSLGYNGPTFYTGNMRKHQPKLTVHTDIPSLVSHPKHHRK